MSTTKECNKHTRRLKALAYGFKHPTLLKKTVKDSIGFLYAQGSLRKASLPMISADDLYDKNTEIKLLNFNVREGNVTHLELLIISSLIASKSPLNLLEIGTFDGNTTLQMALNSPAKAIVHTIDLGNGQIDTQLPMWKEDLKYVVDAKKISRKFINSPVQGKVIQHFGDSTSYDFSKFTQQGKIDFCFIDGGHSYECVKCDTEKILSILGEKGTVLWHDFSPNCPGVYHHLIEASKMLPLKHIEGTDLVIYEKLS